ncbi:MAG: hydroxymethylglutaryl-CoA lyase [Lacibacter sp.]
MPPIKLIECPRDAMQGWKSFIPTEQKVRYIQSLLNVGFHTLDFGSFVSPKAIPQMADTKEVLRLLNLDASLPTKLLAIIANERGAEEATAFDEITYLGFPFSVSETFQQRNTNSSIAESLKRVETIFTTCEKNKKELVVYLSMGFGNPYGDPWNEEIVFKWGNQLAQMGIRILSLADTVGVATPEQVYQMTSFMIQELPECEIGVHLHATNTNWKSKVDAAYKAGCIRFDGALRGIGGCPMAKDELVGNMDTVSIISFLDEQNVNLSINKEALAESLLIADELFKS